MVKGVALKYHEPPEARKPTKNWRLYVFKGDEQVGECLCCHNELTPDLVQIYNQSCYLVGRDTVVTDITVAHPSCSKQHAVIQFRQLTTKNEYGDTKSEIKPYLLDLDSTNGSYVNGQEIPKSRYYELRASDGELRENKADSSDQVWDVVARICAPARGCKVVMPHVHQQNRKARSQGFSVDRIPTDLPTQSYTFSIISSSASALSSGRAAWNASHPGLATWLLTG